MVHSISMKKLSELSIGQNATVRSIAESALRPKLLEMGLIQGQDIRVLFKAPFGDPIAVEIGTYVLSMRKDEAMLVEIA